MFFASSRGTHRAVRSRTSSTVVTMSGEAVLDSEEEDSDYVLGACILVTKKTTTAVDRHRKQPHTGGAPGYTRG